jgi:hypothetical protein
VITNAVERAVLLWLFRKGATGNVGLDMKAFTATASLATFLNSGALVKTDQTSFQLYGYVGEEEERKRLPSVTVICPSAQPDEHASGNHVVEVEIELRCSAVSRANSIGNAERDVIDLIEAAGRWLEEVTTAEESLLIEEINNGHEWCTIQMVTRPPSTSRFVEKNTRGVRVSMQLYASLYNYR